MQLNVPLYLQKEGSVDCGIICLQMILEYHGKKNSFLKLKNNLEVDKVGSYAPQIGTYFLKNDFSIEIITQHPGLFTLKDQSKSQTEITQRIKDLLQNTTSNQEKKVLNFFLKYQKHGGKINVKIPDINDIIKDIKNKQPLIALFTSHFLTATQPEFDFYYNVITGFDQRYIYTNNPYPDNRGGKKKYCINEFFYGLYSSTYGDLDNGCLLRIKKN